MGHKLKSFSLTFFQLILLFLAMCAHKLMIKAKQYFTHIKQKMLLRVKLISKLLFIKI